MIILDPLRPRLESVLYQPLGVGSFRGEMDGC